MVRLPLLFLVALLPLLAQGRKIDGTAALVNAEVITLSDLAKLRRTLPFRKELDPVLAFFGKNPKSDTELRDFLVQETLISTKFPVSKEEVSEEVNGILRRNNIDLDGLKAVLKQQGISYETYSDLMTVSLAKRKLMDRELRPLSAVTPDEVKNYYYTAPEFLERKQQTSMLLSYGLIQLRLPSRAIADEVRDRLKQGEDIDAIANQFADRGVSMSDLGVLREDKIADSIRKSIEGLKVGEYTPAVSLGTDEFVVHKVSSISAPHDPVFEEKKEKIQDTLFRKAMDRQLFLWTERAKADAYVFIPE